MSKKSSSRRNKEAQKSGFELNPDESRELSMIMDRLAVQSPEGESLENCLRSLCNTLKGRPGLIVSLIETLSKQPSEVGFRAFLLLREMVDDKGAVRVLKQASYRFSQRGYEIPSVQGTQDVLLVPREARESVAYMTMEAEPCFLVSALVHSAGVHEPTALVAYFKDTFDDLRFDIASSSVKGFRGFLGRASSSAPSPLCEIPIWHAARLVFEMLEWSTGSRPALSASMRRVLEPFHDSGRRPYAYDLFEEIVELGQRLTEIDVRRLLELLPVRWLLFSKDDLKPWREAVVTAGQSVLVVPQETKLQRVEALIREAADTLCQGSKRLFMQRFLEEGAMWLHLTRRRTEASWTWVLAQQLVQGGHPGDSPFVTQLLAMSLYRHWPEDYHSERAGSEYSQSQIGSYDTTESGLIIPR